MDCGDAERVAQTVERQRARYADHVSSHHDATAKTARFHHVPVEVDRGVVLIETGDRRLIGFFDGHPVDMVEPLAG